MLFRSDKTGDMVAIMGVVDGEDLMIITKNGLTIRQTVDELRVMGRATQGVKLIRLRPNDAIAAVEVVPHDEEEEQVEGEGAQPTDGAAESAETDNQADE